MKVFAVLVSLFLVIACRSEQKPVSMEANFNIVVYDPGYGDVIDLKKGLIEYPDRFDVGSVPFGLNTSEVKQIFSTVPWDVLSEMSNYDVSIGKRAIDNPDDRYVLVFTNGKFHKSVVIRYAMGSDDEKAVKQILGCIDVVHKVVRPKSNVRPLLRFDA